MRGENSFLDDTWIFLIPVIIGLVFFFIVGFGLLRNSRHGDVHARREAVPVYDTSGFRFCPYCGARMTDYDEKGDYDERQR